MCDYPTAVAHNSFVSNQKIRLITPISSYITRSRNILVKNNSVQYYQEITSFDIPKSNLMICRFKILFSLQFF